MSRWQRPSAAPLSRRRAIVDRIRRTDPTRVAKRLLAVMGVAVLAQLGWQWRVTTTDLGQREHVVVMNNRVLAGATVTEQDVQIVAWPTGLTPAGAARSLPPGSVAADDLFEGEVLLTQRLFPTSGGLDADQRLVTISQPLAPPPLAQGTDVELFGVLPIGDGFTTPATRLAVGTVTNVTDTSISVAVAAQAVPTIIEHATLGTVEVVVRP